VLLCYQWQNAHIAAKKLNQVIKFAHIAVNFLWVSNHNNVTA
jgi:hypothetical protein